MSGTERESPSAPGPGPASEPPFELSVWIDGRPAPGGQDYVRRYEEVVEKVKLADQLGYRSVWTTELHGTDDGYISAQLPLLAGLATVTESIRLMTAVLIVPYYNVRQILEAAVVVDLLSHGRLELGVGLGVYEEEFALFRADKRRRGRVLEEALPLLRQGLDEGTMPDAPDGRLVPLTPRPAQPHVPIFVGGMSAPAVDRAVRLGDGTVANDTGRVEENIPAFWRTVLEPALARHSRTLQDFRFLASAALWVSDDPERAWFETYRPAFAYQQGKYQDLERNTEAQASPILDMEAHFVGTPEDVAKRLLETWQKAPWHEFGFWGRLPGIAHEAALENLELIQSRLVPELRRLAANRPEPHSSST